MSTTPFDPELEAGLRQAVESLRTTMQAHYEGAAASEMMADLHYLAHELVDQQMEELTAQDPQWGAPDADQGALLDLREQLARFVHRVIEEHRVSDAGDPG